MSSERGGVAARRGDYAETRDQRFGGVVLPPQAIPESDRLIALVEIVERVIAARACGGSSSSRLRLGRILPRLAERGNGVLADRGDHPARQPTWPRRCLGRAASRRPPMPPRYESPPGPRRGPPMARPWSRARSRPRAPRRDRRGDLASRRLGTVIRRDRIEADDVAVRARWSDAGPARSGP